jgi:hypothetical protein
MLPVMHFTKPLCKDLKGENSVCTPEVIRIYRYRGRRLVRPPESKTA